MFTVMIVDDESWVVRGLTDIIDWQSEGFIVLGGYTDPIKALADVRSKEPDLVLLDIKMPKMSGIVLMEIIREEGIPCEFMILSGNSDFSTAKQAIRQGAFDYLLKPFEKNELLESVRRVAKMLEERKTNRRKQPVDPKNANEVLSALGLSVNQENKHTWYRLMLLGSDDFQVYPTYDGVTIYGPASGLAGKFICIMAYDDINEEKFIGYLISWAEENKLSAGVSKPAKSTLQYHNMYRQASCALCSVHLLEQSGCYFYTSPNLEEVKQWQNELLSAYESGDADRVLGVVTKLVDLWRLTGNPASVSLLVALLTYRIAADSHEPESQDKFEMFLLDDITSQYLDTGELFNHLILLLSVGPKLSKEAEFVKTAPRIIRDMRRYLLENYSEELNLSRLSTQFFLAPSYLSELLSRYSGETISRFLLRARMEKAAELLAISDKSLVIISEEVGYNDYNYFCRLFKRYFGMSPTRYRKEHKVQKRSYE